MNIALDFDGTLTAMPNVWAPFINEAKRAGHTVLVMTAREDTNENREIVSDYLERHGFDLHTVFTDRRSKLEVAKERGMKIDVWIDDDVVSVVRGI